MYTVTITFSPEKSKVCDFFFRKLTKNPNLKFKKSTKIRVFNFFSFFLLQNHFIKPLCWSKRTACFHHVSFYFIFINPQKTPNSRENRGNLEIGSPEIEKIIIFVISGQKSLRKVMSLEIATLCLNTPCLQKKLYTIGIEISSMKTNKLTICSVLQYWLSNRQF